ncbi:hypothetical protein [Vibrio rarus]|uniref:hypothetical protein n=1 Tax=Vibrio rarus TaxID=413403 RepID=UPI0021C402B7|nr:hypothetical protein [Vibrio rarus]
MVRRLLIPAFVLFLLLLPFYGEEIWQFLSNDPVRDVQDWGQGIIKGFNRFISG